jgi:hypothetical protein
MVKVGSDLIVFETDASTGAAAPSAAEPLESAAAPAAPATLAAPTPKAAAPVATPTAATSRATATARGRLRRRPRRAAA